MHSTIRTFTVTATKPVPQQRRATIIPHALRHRRWVVGAVLGTSLFAATPIQKPALANVEIAPPPLSSVDDAPIVAPIEIELTPKDAFYITQSLRLGEILDDYLEVVRLNNAEHVLCNDPVFMHTLAAFDLMCKRIQADEVRTVLAKKYEVFNLRCGGDEEIKWA